MTNMNPEYTNEKEKISEIITSTGYILLSNILTQESYKKLIANVKKLTFKDNTILDIHRFKEGKQNKEISQLMAELVTYVKDTLKEQLTPVSIRIRKYSKGSFTMQHDQQPQQGIDLVLFITEGEWHNDYRGEVTYVSEQPIYFYPQSNTLAIVIRTEQMHSFIKRVSHFADKVSFITIEMNLKREFV